MDGLTQQQQIDARQRYVTAFNDMMVKMWKEQIVLLEVMDTGALLQSPVGVRCDHDSRIVDISLGQEFLEYGLWQDYGTGRETWRGNPGDIGHDKVRERRKWFSRKFYSSVMNIRDFMADSLGREFCGIVADALDPDKMRG